jgi:hypothetical protein
VPAGEIEEMGRETDGGWKEGMMIGMRSFDYFDCW